MDASALMENPPKVLIMTIEVEPPEAARDEVQDIVEAYDTTDWWGDLAYGMDYPDGGYTVTVMTKTASDAMNLRNELMAWKRRHRFPGHIDIEANEYDDGLTPNKRARPLGSRPSMDTRFGRTLDDPDSVGGTRGKHLDAAMDRYETFHAKAPIRVAELAHNLPDRWEPVGDALAVMYRTDKWKKDGVDEDYKHLHDKSDGKEYDRLKGVRFFEPARNGRRLPVRKPQALTLLGYCLGAFVRKDDDGQEYETNPRGCYLFCSPSGDALYLYSPDEQSDGSSGFLAAAVGGNLRVLRDGIDG